MPDCTTTAREVTLLITAMSDTDRPVVPTMCTRPRSAAIATLAMVAAGTVKSRMPSALADSVHRSAESLTPFSGRPASTPASLPSSSEPGASSAPAKTAPGVSEMTRTSARPIRPPAPATINRISAMALPLYALYRDEAIPATNQGLKHPSWPSIDVVLQTAEPSHDGAPAAQDYGPS